MGWFINEVENTVKVPRATALAILNSECEIAGVIRDYDFERPAEDFLGELLYEGKFQFNSDHMEHMDYVWEKGVIEALKAAKAKGTITFSSNDGDNRGQVWSYVFDGKGGFEYRKGTIKGLVKGTPMKKAKLTWYVDGKEVVAK
jgi:hypothetical protein